MTLDYTADPTSGPRTEPDPRKDTDMTSSPHHHVFAMQDRGGRQEYARGFDEPLTREQAQQLARDMLDADTLAYGTATSGGNPDQAAAEYGDRFGDLVSDNVNPGWHAVWVVGCTEPCSVREIFHGSTWGHPTYELDQAYNGR